MYGNGETYSARMSEGAIDYGYTNEKQPFPLLHPGDRGRLSNLPEWKVNAYSYLNSKHGGLAAVIATGEKQVQTIPSLKDNYGSPLPDNELLFRKKQIEYLAKKALDDSIVEQKLASDIFSFLSVESKTLVREVRMEARDSDGEEVIDADGYTVYEDWDQVVNKDPHAIMRRIDKTHMTANTGNELKDRCYLLQEFSDLRQKKDESLGRFLDRFNSLLKIMKANNCHIETDDMLTTLFIFKLREETYHEFKAMCDNDYRRNPAFYPKSVMEAYNAAMYHCPMTDKASRVLVNAETRLSKGDKDLTPATAFQAAVNFSDRVEDAMNRRAGVFPKVNHSSSMTTAQTPSSGNGRWGPQAGRFGSDPRIPRKCDYCEKEHFHRDCPTLRKILKEAKVTPASTLTDKKERLPKRKVTFTAQDEDIFSDAEQSDNDVRTAES
jgi:hypothetical protein